MAVYDAGALPGGSHYLVMERLSGHDLARTICAYGPGRFTQVAALVEQGSLALAAAHREGLLHRDIKPSNVFLTASEHSDGFRVKIVDFGIAQVALATDGGQPGSLVGTPAYMSPEQIQGEVLDARSDIYLFAAVCYEALTGRRTVGTIERLNDLLLEVLLTTPPPASASRA